MLRALILILLSLACTTPAQAHTRSQSASHWRIDGDRIQGRVEADALDGTRLYALGGDQLLPETFRRYAEAAFTLETGAGRCARVGAATISPAPNARLAANIVFQCPAGSLADGRVSLRSQLFLDVAPSHLHFASIGDGAGREAESVLTDAHRRADFVLEGPGSTESAWSAFKRFIPVGAEHVWGGLDHLAFILALALLAKRVTAIAFAATGFTLGHTATLALAALGVVRPEGPTVEALIGFTVAFVALEAARDGEARMTRWSRPLAVLLVALAAASMLARWPVSAVALLGLALFSYCYPRGFRRGAAVAPWLAAAFGLIHGCGFAGALSELDLPRPHLLSALAGFNIGVELAQIVVVTAALGVAFAVRRFAPARAAPAGDLVAAGLFGIGVYWFVSRTIGA